MSTMMIHHIAIKTPGVEVLYDFYAGILGLATIQAYFKSDGSIRSIWLQSDQPTILMLEHVENAIASSTPPAVGMHLMAMAIDPADRAAWVARLEGAVVEIDGESDYSVYFHDPDGNRLALSHYPHSRV